MAAKENSVVTDLSKLDKLLLNQTERLTESEANVARWRNFRNDYSALRTRLETLPERLSHEVTVPLGRLAFMPGRLVHTNELLVLLGDNWFCKTSAINACGIVDRRLKHCSEMLSKAEAECHLLSDWKTKAEEFQASSGGGNTRDICEPLDEEQERLWKESRRKRLADERRRENAQRLQDRQDGGDDELMKRLEALELQERTMMRNASEGLSRSAVEESCGLEELSAVPAARDGADSPGSGESTITDESEEEESLDSDDSSSAGSPGEDAPEPASVLPEQRQQVQQKRVFFSGDPPQVRILGNQEEEGVEDAGAGSCKSPLSANMSLSSSLAIGAGSVSPKSILKNRGATELPPADGGENSSGRPLWLSGGVDGNDSVRLRNEKLPELRPPTPPLPRRPELSEVFSFKIVERDVADSATISAPTTPEVASTRPVSRFRSARTGST